MISTSKTHDGHDTEMPVTMPVEQVEDVPSGLRHDEKGFSADDIHETALVDHPETAERLSLATILSIMVCSYLPLAKSAPLDGRVMG